MARWIIYFGYITAAVVILSMEYPSAKVRLVSSRPVVCVPIRATVEFYRGAITSAAFRKVNIIIPCGGDQESWIEREREREREREVVNGCWTTLNYDVQESIVHNRAVNCASEQAYSSVQVVNN